MFKAIKIGDKVGVSSPKGQLPYELVSVTEVYESFISIGLSCDADGLFYRYSGKLSGKKESMKHIVPEAQARLANKLVQEQNRQDFMTAISWDFEQQIDRIKKQFYTPSNEPTIHQLQGIVEQLKQIG